MFSETIELRGHIIDSLILPKVLDEILRSEANFKIGEVRIGQKRADQSYARIEVSGKDGARLDDLILRLRQHGAEVIEKANARTAAAPADGVFPKDFYVTTNQQTFVRIKDKEIEVQPTMMDSGIALDRAAGTARAVKFYDFQKGTDIVIGHQGIRVVPLQRVTSHTDVFQFINTAVSAETPKRAVIRELAREFERVRSAKSKILVVAGPSLVHAGAGPHLEQLVEWGYVDRLFTGNALAVYDIESALFGTSLGVSVEQGALLEGGHDNHMQAINIVREAGGIAAAVKKKILTRGIMYACVRHGVDIVLSGSIRDDGPILGVTTDTVEAQKIMRAKLADVSLVLMMGTVLHSVAVAKMLPASVKTVCVDIDANAVARITNKRSFSSIGLVTDIEPFLRELTRCIAKETKREGRSAKAR